MNTRISIFDSETKQFGSPDMFFLSRILMDTHKGILTPEFVSASRILLRGTDGQVRLDIALVDAENYN